MPPVTKASSSRLSAGDELETRIAQLWFWEGSFARRAVNMSRHFHPEPLLVTDLDLLAFDFGPNLERRKVIGEAKSGTGRSAQKPLDRVIWLRGLMALTDADRAELTTAIVPSLRVRQLGDMHGVDVQSVADLQRREKAASIDEVADLGAFGPAFLPTLASVADACKEDARLERAFWFLRSEVWFLDPWAATKRTMTVLHETAKRWTPRARDNEEFAVRWLLCEGLAVFTFNLVTLAGQAIRLPQDDFTVLAAERLSEGAIPAVQMRALSEAIDRYVSGVLRQLDAPETAIVQAMGAFMPTPPDYAPSVIEVLRRLAARPQHVRHLPRWVDLVCSERILREREVSELAIRRLSLEDPDRTASAARVVATFLRGQVGVPAELLDAMATPIGKYEPAPPSSTDAGASTPDPHVAASTGSESECVGPSLFEK